VSYTGWIIVALAIVVAVYWTPALIRNRKQVIETPVEDRFSCDLKLVSMDQEQPGLAVRGDLTRHQPRILTNCEIRRLESHPVIHVDAKIESVDGGGRSMSKNKDRTAPAGGVPSTSRELAKLRASRAARISSENAAGKRRFAIAGISLTLLVAFIVAAFFSSFAWGWALIPLAVLASTIVEGRIAYRRSVAESAREVAELRRLRNSRGREQERFDKVRAGVKKRFESTPVVEETPEDVAVETEIEVEEESVEAPAEWTPRPLPKPLYAQSKAAPRRRVVMDPSVVEATSSAIDVETSEEDVPAVPVRPKDAKPMPNDAMTSEEAAAEAPVAFNLEEILEQRRAQ
jgi:hypothetical protein